MRNKKVIKEHYRAVLKNLKKGAGKKCKEYCIGCYQCDVWRLIDNLQSFYDMEFNSKPYKI